MKVVKTLAPREQTFEPFDVRIRVETLAELVGLLKRLSKADPFDKYAGLQYVDFFKPLHNTLEEEFHKNIPF